MDDQQLTVEVVPDGGTVTLVVAGELDLSTVGTLRACTDDLDDGFRSVWLDLSGLTFLDSTGVGFIAGLHQRCGPQLRDLTVRCPEGAVRTVLSISGIDQVVKVVE